ncbi:MAG: GntR family transcriptional regulator [Planctomycetota bacterium]
MKVSDYITEDLRGLVETGQPLPYSLTLTAIAEHYNVSLTPVRHATARLIDCGVLRKTDRGRLEVAIEPLKNGAKPPEGRPLQLVDIEDRVRTDLIAMSLRGHSGFVREEWSAEKYGIGRTALRPILSRLAGAGLIEKAPRRGWRIHPFNAADLADFIEVRELLELRALRLARRRLDPAILTGYLERNQQAARDGTLSLDNDLHRYWVDLSGNRYIREFFLRDAVYYRTVFDFATPEARLVSEMAEQHCAVLKALLAKDWTGAAKQLGIHIRAQQSIVETLVSKLQASDDPVSESA